MKMDTEFPSSICHSVHFIADSSVSFLLYIQTHDIFNQRSTHPSRPQPGPTTPEWPFLKYFPHYHLSVPQNPVDISTFANHVYSILLPSPTGLWDTLRTGPKSYLTVSKYSVIFSCLVNAC